MGGQEKGWAREWEGKRMSGQENRRAVELHPLYSPTSLSPHSLAISFSRHFILLPFHSPAISFSCDSILLPFHSLAIPFSCPSIILPFHSPAVPPLPLASRHAARDVWPFAERGAASPGWGTCFASRLHLLGSGVKREACRLRPTLLVRVSTSLTSWIRLR